MLSASSRHGSRAWAPGAGLGTGLGTRPTATRTDASERQVGLDLLQHERVGEVLIRVHGGSAYADLEMEVRGGDAAGCARITQDLAAADFLAGKHFEAR